MTETPEKPVVTAAVLLYGDTPHYARRCLQPLVTLRNAGWIDLRVGANDPSADTMAVCDDLKVSPIVAAPQILKYPMMRKLFYDKPIETELTMWFDDDSYISSAYSDLSTLTGWLKAVMKEFSTKNIGMLGGIYYPGYTLDDAAKKWFKQRYPNVGTIERKPKFCTGGWWTIRTKILHELNWPHPDLTHNGGDVALGALMGASGYHLHAYRTGVWINAGDTGKESAAPRRGVSEKPPFLS